MTDGDDDLVGFGGPGERLGGIGGGGPSSVQSRWWSRSPRRLKAAHRVPGWSRPVRYRPDRPEGLYTFFHRECRFAASHAAAETAEVPVGFPSPICHRPIRHRGRNTLVV